MSNIAGTIHQSQYNISMFWKRLLLSINKVKIQMMPEGNINVKLSQKVKLRYGQIYESGDPLGV